LGGNDPKKRGSVNSLWGGGGRIAKKPPKRVEIKKGAGARGESCGSIENLYAEKDPTGE